MPDATPVSIRLAMGCLAGILVRSLQCSAVQSVTAEGLPSRFAAQRAGSDI